MVRFAQFRFTFPWKQRFGWAKLFIKTLPRETTLQLNVSMCTIVIQTMKLREFVRAFAQLRRVVPDPDEITVTTQRMWREMFLAGCLPEYTPPSFAAVADVALTTDHCAVINEVVQLADFREKHAFCDIGMLTNSPTRPRITNAASAQAIIAAVHLAKPIHAAYIEPTNGSFILQFQNWRNGFVSCIAPENGRVTEDAPALDFDEGFCDPSWNAWFPQVMLDLAAWRKNGCKDLQVLRWHGLVVLK